MYLSSYVRRLLGKCISPLRVLAAQITAVSPGFGTLSYKALYMKILTNKGGGEKLGFMCFLTSTIKFVIIIVWRSFESVAPHGGPGGGLNQPPVPLHPHHHRRHQQQNQRWQYHCKDLYIFIVYWVVQTVFVKFCVYVNVYIKQYKILKYMAHSQIIKM